MLAYGGVSTPLPKCFHTDRHRQTPTDTDRHTHTHARARMHTGMNLVFALLACVALSFATVRMDCGTKSINDTADESTSPSVSTCCKDFEATCGRPSATNQDIFVCPQGEHVADDKINVPNPIRANCCTDYDDWSCREYTQTQQGEYQIFQCPGNKVLDSSNNLERPTEETCCKPFSPDCGHIDATNTFTYNGFGYHIYDCPAGKTFNVDNSQNPTVTAAVCCEDFSPTCEFNSGSILDQRPFVCPSGKTFNKTNNDEPAYETTCCMDFTPSCSLLTAAGAIFKCPTGKTQISDFDNKTGTPNEANCCTEPTCASLSQSTCADFHAKEDFCHDHLKQRDATKDADVTIEDRRDAKLTGKDPGQGNREVFSR